MAMSMSMSKGVPKGREMEDLMRKLWQESPSRAGCKRCVAKFKEEGWSSSFVCKICAAAKEEETCAAKEVEICASKVEAKEGWGSCVVCKISVAKGVDSWSRAGCKICLAKASALDRIKAGGGDSIKAAEESASRAGRDICVMKGRIVPARGNIIKAADGKAAGVVKKTVRVPEAYVQELLTDPQVTPLLPLSEDFFQKYPHLRESTLAGAATALRSIERHENILAQFFEKGFAVMEVVAYD